MADRSKPPRSHYSGNYVEVAAKAMDTTPVRLHLSQQTGQPISKSTEIFYKQQQ